MMISTILLSGGVGSRSGKNLPKQYYELLGKKIINYCLDSIVEAGATHELIVVYGDGFLELLHELLEAYKDRFDSVKFVVGGKSRQESVFNGLSECTGETVLLHESARPLVTAQDITSILEHSEENVTMGVDIPFTVLRQDNGHIKEVLTRDELFNVQLPQKFSRAKLLAAHNRANIENKIFTDDSSLLFNYGDEVGVIKGSGENIKITSPGDFLIAEQILSSRT